MNLFITSIGDSNSRYLRPLQCLIHGFPKKPLNMCAGWHLRWFVRSGLLSYTVWRMCLCPHLLGLWISGEKRSASPRAEMVGEYGPGQGRTGQRSRNTCSRGDGLLVCPCKTPAMNTGPLLRLILLSSPNACVHRDFLSGLVRANGYINWRLTFLLLFERRLVQSKKRGELYQKMWCLSKPDEQVTSYSPCYIFQNLTYLNKWIRKSCVFP